MSIINDALKKTQNKLKGTPEEPKKEDTENQKTEASVPETANVYDKMYQNKLGSKPIDGSTKPPSKEKGNGKNKDDSPQKSNNKKTIIIVTLIIFFLAGISTGFYVLVGKKDSSFQKNVRKWKSQKYLKSPPKRNYKEGEIVLKGTMVSGDEKAALINDRIFELGDMIDGNKIMNITEDSIDILDEAGKTHTIKTRNYE